MAENNTEAALEAVSMAVDPPKQPEVQTANNEAADNTAAEEPPAKKAKAEPKKNKSPHKRTDELMAAEAKAMCGAVDTSSGRQLRKREPPKVEAKPKKEPAAKAKKEPTPKKEPAAKRGRGAKAKVNNDEGESDEKESSTVEGNSTEDAQQHKECADKVPEAPAEEKKEPVAAVPEKEAEAKPEPEPTPAPSTTDSEHPTTAGSDTSPPKTE